MGSYEQLPCAFISRQNHQRIKMALRKESGNSVPPRISRSRRFSPRSQLGQMLRCHRWLIASHQHHALRILRCKSQSSHAEANGGRHSFLPFVVDHRDDVSKHTVSQDLRVFRANDHDHRLAPCFTSHSHRVFEKIFFTQPNQLLRLAQSRRTASSQHNCRNAHSAHCACR